MSDTTNTPADLFSHPEGQTMPQPGTPAAPHAPAAPERAQPADMYTLALRARLAADYGVSEAKGENGEASDAELLLSGKDEATITAQALRLIEIDHRAERRRLLRGNVAPHEGKTSTPERNHLTEFTRELFG